MDKSLIVSGRVTVRSDKREQAVEAVLELVQATRQEDGCREFRAFTDLTDPCTLCIFEVWENVEAMTRHFQTTHMATFQEHLKKVAVGEPEVKRYVVAA
jgi:quinol monooxygenase YgiN